MFTATCRTNIVVSGETEEEREKGRRRITVDHPEKREGRAIQNLYEENVFYRRAFAPTTPPVFGGEGERDWLFLAQISKLSES